MRGGGKVMAKGMKGGGAAKAVSPRKAMAMGMMGGGKVKPKGMKGGGAAKKAAKKKNKKKNK